MRRLKAKLAVAIGLVLGLSEVLMAAEEERGLFFYTREGALTPTLLDVFLGPVEPLL